MSTRTRRTAAGLAILFAALCVGVADAGNTGPSTAPSAAASSADAISTQPPINTAEIVAGLAEVTQEVAALRKDVNRLQETVDTYFSSLVADLKRENQRLRSNLVGSASGQPADASEPPAELPPSSTSDVPAIPGVSPSAGSTTPADSLLVTPEAAGAQGTEGKRPTKSEKRLKAKTPSGSGVAYTTVKEWGRDPEDAVRLGKNVSSLKGMICVVPSQTSDADLIALGRRLRAEFDGYDNISIEVFNDETAAQNYSEKNEQSTAHHVFSISRHRKAGPDVLLLLRNDVVTVVQRQDP